jgi:hypothetical protein
LGCQSGHQNAPNAEIHLLGGLGALKKPWSQPDQCLIWNWATYALSGLEFVDKKGLVL